MNRKVANSSQFRKGPQYKRSDSAAAVEADANPNITKMTDGKQHKLARTAEVEIQVQSDFLSAMNAIKHLHF